MGRYYPNAKVVAEDCLRLSIYNLRHLGYFKERLSGTVSWSRQGEAFYAVYLSIRWRGATDSMYMQLKYAQTDRNTGQYQSFDYQVDLDITDCNYGNYRYWFKCPLTTNGIKCGRRVGVLYQRGGYFGCRHCRNLSYASRNENSSFRQYPWRIIENDYRREKLEARMKYRYYAGKPTKLYRRILALNGATSTGAASLALQALK